MNKCEGCQKPIDYEPITISADPYSPGLCYECLPADVRLAYDKFTAGLEPEAKEKETS